MTLGLAPIYVINNILEKPGTLSLDDNALWRRRRLRHTAPQDRPTGASLKDPHVCVRKLHVESSWRRQRRVFHLSTFLHG